MPHIPSHNPIATSYRDLIGGYSPPENILPWDEYYLDQALADMLSIGSSGWMTGSQYLTGEDLATNLGSGHFTLGNEIIQRDGEWYWEDPKFTAFNVDKFWEEYDYFKPF